MCKVCRDNYSLQNEPVSLQCGHSFCRECLGHLEKRGALHCPICSTQETRGPVHLLPVNHDLLMEACPDAVPTTPVPAPPPSDARMSILVVPGETDPPLTIHVLPTIKVKDIKVLLRVNHGLDCSGVYFQGCPLDDLTTLQHNHVTKGNTLHLDPGGSVESDLLLRPAPSTLPHSSPQQSLHHFVDTKKLQDVRKWLEKMGHINTKNVSDGLLKP
ncbi:hypothetical protein Pmani_012508 [Petrolisthes manimaculis]|uniref:RING-type domain-containing protein n=1 Tax=Petrolisthes manimaculis TaxID=1843537 RepID=A0AAE1UF07_9EUCA|nr:hypothetical protein Pmani_012508 [Petrolisthes manimaculis]